MILQPGWHGDKTLRFHPRTTGVSGSVLSLDINVAKPCDKYPSLGMDESCTYSMFHELFNVSRIDGHTNGNRSCLMSIYPGIRTHYFFGPQSRNTCIFKVCANWQNGKIIGREQCLKGHSPCSLITPNGVSWIYFSFAMDYEYIYPLGEMDISI